MTRKKVKLAFIADDSTRRATYKKRKKGLLKKLDELSILCDIKACAVISSQFESNTEAWPSPMEAQAVIAKFKNLPDIDQSMRMMNQESFIRTRIEKTLDQLKTKQVENDAKMMKQVMFDVMNGNGVPPNMNMQDFLHFISFVEGYMRDVSSRMEYLNREEGMKNGVDVHANIVNEHAMQPAVGTIVPAENVSKDSEAIQGQKWIAQMMSSPPNSEIFEFAGPSGNFGLAEDNQLPLLTFNEQNSFWSDPHFP